LLEEGDFETRARNPDFHRLNGRPKIDGK